MAWRDNRIIEIGTIMVDSCVTMMITTGVHAVAVMAAGSAIRADMPKPPGADGSIAIN